MGGLRALLAPPWLQAQPEPCRRALHLAVLLSAFGLVLAIIVFINNALFPVPEAGPDFHRLSILLSGSFAGCALVCFILMMLGLPRIARPLLLFYVAAIIYSFAYTVGRDAGVDLIGAIVLVFLPALIYAGSEPKQKIIATVLMVLAIIGLQYWLMAMPPAFTLPADEIAILHFNAILVGMAIGGFIIYLHLTAERARDAVLAEKARADGLLRNILPNAVAERLKAGDHLVADRHAELHVLFADLVGFTKMSADRPAAEIVTVLNHLFSAFDDLCDQYGIEKIKTMGDGYLAVSGLPGCRDPEGAAAALADFAIAMRDATLEMGRDLDEPFSIRLGLHSGPAISGVIGKRKFAFDLWGATVNIASRMESNSEPGLITISSQFKGALGAGFIIRSRGRITAKGVGEVEVFALEGRA